jgi:hypothetical protein
VIQERSNNGGGRLREATHGDRIGIAVGALTKQSGVLAVGWYYRFEFLNGCVVKNVDRVATHAIPFVIGPFRFDKLRQIKPAGTDGIANDIDSMLIGCLDNLSNRSVLAIRINLLRRRGHQLFADAFVRTWACAARQADDHGIREFLIYQSALCLPHGLTTFNTVADPAGSVVATIRVFQLFIEDIGNGDFGQLSSKVG